MRYLKLIFTLGILGCSGIHGSAQKVLLDTNLVKDILRQNEASKIQIQQLTKEVSDLKFQLQRQQKSGYDKFSAVSQFLDAATSSANNLQSLILKESYRNKIASLNNPTSNELGFSLEMEIGNALKPLLQKAKKTNTSKFSQVVGSFLETGKRSSASLFPAGNVFTSIVGMVGNLTVQERSIDQDDLNNFIKGIEKYFSQYERLYQSNLSFNTEMEKLKARLKLLQDDIKILLQDMVVALDRPQKRSQLKNMSNHILQNVKRHFTFIVSIPPASPAMSLTANYPHPLPGFPNTTVQHLSMFYSA